MASLVRVEEPRPGVAHAIMCRGNKRNALSNALKAALIEVAKDLGRRTEIGAVVLSGEGEHFCSGNDIVEEGAFGEGLLPAQARQALRVGPALTDSLALMPQLTIAAVRGGAIGGGVALALACDFRVFSACAWLHTPEVELGLPLGWNTLPRLVALAGPARAKRIAALSERIDAEKALAWGLCEEIAEDPVETALALGEGIAKLPRVSQQIVKENINRLACPRLDGDLEVDQVLLARDDPDGLRRRQATVSRLMDKKRS